MSFSKARKVASAIVEFCSPLLAERNCRTTSAKGAVWTRADARFATDSVACEPSSPPSTFAVLWMQSKCNAFVKDLSIVPAMPLSTSKTFPARGIRTKLAGDSNDSDQETSASAVSPSCCKEMSVSSVFSTNKPLSQSESLATWSSNRWIPKAISRKVFWCLFAVWLACHSAMQAAASAGNSTNRKSAMWSVSSSNAGRSFSVISNFSHRAVNTARASWGQAWGWLCESRMRDWVKLDKSGAEAMSLRGSKVVCRPARTFLHNVMSTMELPSSSPVPGQASAKR